MSDEKASSSVSHEAADEVYPEKQDSPRELSAKDPASTSSDPQYPTGLKLGIIIFGLCLAVFCVALDGTIIATAIPRITDDFHALQDVGWYGSAYLLTTCAFQLFYGKLYSRFNIKVVFLAALLIFEVGSLICGLAPNTVALIVGVRKT